MNIMRGSYQNKRRELSRLGITHCNNENTGRQPQREEKEKFVTPKRSLSLAPCGCGHSTLRAPFAPGLL